MLLTTPLQADFDPGGAAKQAVRRRRRLTLACPEVSAFPSVLAGLLEVEDQSFADGVAATPIDTNEVGINLAEASSPVSMVLQSSNEVDNHECFSPADDEALQDCIMAGYSYEEARDYISEKKKCSSYNDEIFVENFWADMGFPKGTRWWENERSPVGSNPEHKQCVSSEPSSPQRAKQFSLPSKRKGASNPDIRKKGFALRSWKGPLPKRRSQVITLEAFLPETARKRLLHPVRPLHADLIARARDFGRSIWDLIPNGPKKINRAPLPGRELPTPTPSLTLAREPRCPRSDSSPVLVAKRDQRSFADVVRSSPMPPYPRFVDRGRGRGPNPGRRDGRSHGDFGGGGFQAHSRAQHPAGRGREYGREVGREHGREHGASAGREHGASDGRSAHPGRGGGGADQQFSRSAGNQSQQQYVPILPSSKADFVQQGAEREQQQLEQGALKKRKPFCFRCKCSGHVNENCKANLDCVICNKKNSHLSAKCPILKMPKPNASFFGSGKKEFAFIRITDVDYKLETPDPSPTGLVTVSGGRITAEVVQSELARIIRTDWKWEALVHDENSFLVAFPSDDSLQRMVDIGFQLKNHGVTLTVSVWQNDQDIAPTYELEEVWVHVTGVPHAYRHYLVFWAVGTVIGATLEVDMLTYRMKGVIRIKVGMMDKRQLPHTTDLVFGTQGYHVTFAQEDELFLPATLPPEDDDPMDFDNFRDGNGSAEDKDRDDSSKKLKRMSQPESSLPQTKNVGSGPAPMQCWIAVTPMGNRRSCPPRKPVLSEGTTKSTKIAVTVPRGGFRPIPGNTFGKYHPFFTSEYGCVKSDFSQCLLSDAVKQQGEVIDTPLGVDALSTGMGAQMAGPMGDSSMVMDKNPQELKPALQVQTGSESVTYSSQANVTSPRNNGQCSRFFGSASEELHTVSPFCVADYANSPSSGPSVMASPIIPESNTGTPSPLSDNCCDNFRSSLDLSGTDTVVSAKAGVTTPSKQQVVLASGQPEVFTPAAFTTPTNTIAGTEWDDTFGVGSVFVDGKRRSAWANYSYSADGNPTANELVLDKAKRHAAIRNLDRTSSPGNISSTLKLLVDN